MLLTLKEICWGWKEGGSAIDKMIRIQKCHSPRILINKIFGINFAFGSNISRLWNCWKQKNNNKQSFHLWIFLYKILKFWKKTSTFSHFYTPLLRSRVECFCLFTQFFRQTKNDCLKFEKGFSSISEILPKSVDWTHIDTFILKVVFVWHSFYIHKNYGFWLKFSKVWKKLKLESDVFQSQKKFKDFINYWHQFSNWCFWRQYYLFSKWSTPEWKLE